MSLTQFNVSVTNKPGEVARLTEVLAGNEVNIRGISTNMNKRKGTIRVITDDENSARSALREANMEFSEDVVMVVTLPDRPGELAKVTKKLARAGINIHTMFILGSSSSTERVAIGVDRMEEAQEVLWKYTS